MDEYPEELRTPPVSLIALVGCPEIHQMISFHLHSEQPPINTLALPDFTKISVMEKKPKGPSADSAPAGIMKRDWLIKHRTRIPAVVAALFSSDHVSGGPTEWLQLCTHLDQLKTVIRARNIKLVIIVVHASSKDAIIEDRMIALRKRAEVDLKHVISLRLDNESELKQSLMRLGSTFAELAGMYYRDEGQQVKSRLEKRNFGYIELAIRCCFKVAVYAEFRRDWVEALKFYEDAYHALREMFGTSTRLPAIQRLAEIKAVAEQVHFKLSTLLLHGGKVIEAVMWFQRHCRYYKRLLESPDVTFMHWEWTSRQFLVFAELLEASSKTVPGFLSLVSASMDKGLTEWELQPVYYYQLASHYLKEKRSYLELAVSLLDTTNDFDAMAESVVPSVYVGQVARLLEQKDDLVTMQPLTDEEFAHYAIVEGKRFQDSFEIIALLKKSFDIYSNLKAVRMASYCAFNMAKEYFSAGDTKKSKEFFESAISFYRHEGWVTLLWEALGFMRECSRRDGSVKEFVEYSLEMAALPILSGESIQSFSYRDVGPAGPPTYERREMILKEIFSIASSEPGSSSNKNESGLTMEAPLHLEIDLVSPLRVALLAAVAFHEQKVKPGTAMPFTLSILSHLPLPLEIDALEVQFNQSDCNFNIVNADKCGSTEASNHQPGYRSETALITLIPNKWLRLTFDVKSEQSGKLECVSIIARIGSYLTICCRAESPASMGDFPLWKFEEHTMSLPTKDPILAFLGQKYIQVDEPEPLVDLSINASGPALVGESFIVPVSITTKGHAVYSGELKINLVDSKGGGLVSPREIDSQSTEGHHVELVGVSGTDANGRSLVDTDNAGRIQHSFGLVSVPLLSDGESWSCILEIKWHRPKPVMLFVSLGYSPYSGDAKSQQVQIHKSLEIEGKVPFVVTHRVMSPFRRDPLLLSEMKTAADLHGLPSLPLNETSILVVSVKNCTEVPLQLLSMSTVKDEDESEPSCAVGPASDEPARPDLLVPGEEYKKLFTVIPVGNSPIVKMGTLCLRWQRDLVANNANAKVVGAVTKHSLPDANAELSPLVLSLECPPHAVLGRPFMYFIKIQNQTELLQEIKFSLVDSPSFVSSGSHSDSVFILPKSTHILSYKLLPLSSGPQQLPRVTMTAIRYSADFNPSNAASTIFVFPSEPQFKMETATNKLVDEIATAK